MKSIKHLDKRKFWNNPVLTKIKQKWKIPRGYRRLADNRCYQVTSSSIERTDHHGLLKASSCLRSLILILSIHHKTKDLKDEKNKCPVNYRHFYRLAYLIILVTRSNCQVCSSLDHYSRNTHDFCTPNLNWTCSLSQFWLYTSQLKCKWHENFYCPMWKSFKNQKHCRLPFLNIFSRSRVIKV